MKKKSVLGILASSAMIVGLLTSPVPVGAASNTSPEYLTGAGHQKVGVYDGEFFANGTPITISAPTTLGKTATVSWNGGSQEIDGDDVVYGGRDSTSSDVELASTSITMNGGKVKLLVAGNKMTNEKKSAKSTIGVSTVDINGGEITQGLSGIDNQNTAFGNSVLQDKKYKDYSIQTLNVTIDNAKVADFRGITSYTYVDDMHVTVGKDASAQLGKMIWGTNGVINKANFTMYSGTTEVAESIYRSNILTKMTYNFMGGKTGTIYAGSYYPEEESAAGTNNWEGWKAGDIDYGFANAIEINVAKDAAYKDIVSGFQLRNDDIKAFKAKYSSDTWRITELKEDASVILNLSSKPTAATLDKNSIVDSNLSNVKTNWKVNGVILDKNNVALDVGETAELKATVNPDYATDKTVSWTSSDTKVATVKAGKIIALSAGTTVITAKAGDKSATCTVTVKAVPVPPTIDPTPNPTPSDKVEVGIKDKTSQAVVADTVSNILGDISKGKEVPTSVMSADTVKAVKEALASGKTVTPKVENKLVKESEVAKELVTKVNELVAKLEKANGTDATVAQYLDLGVMLTADGAALGTVNQLEKAVTFNVALPKELIKEGREFYIVRIHDGVAEKLETAMKDGELTFKTDRFSTYALVYEDKAAGETVKTNDNSEVALFGTVALLAMVVSGLVLIYKKREELLKK